MSRQVLTVPDIPNLNLMYLPLSGGTVTGQVEVSGASGQYAMRNRDDNGAGFLIHAQGNNFYVYDRLKTTNRVIIDTNGAVSLGAAGGTTALLMNGNIGVGTTNYPWHPTYRAIDFPNMAIFTNAASANTLEIGLNTYVGSDGVRHAMVGSLSGGLLQFTNNTMVFWQAAQVAQGAQQTFAPRFNLDGNGTVTLTPAGGATALVASSIGSTGDIQLNPTNNISVNPPSHYLYPNPANTHYCGHPSIPWIAIYAQTGTIQPSHIDTKENIVTLSPTASQQAVLDTEWYEFDYKPGEQLPDQSDEDYRAFVAESASNRHQRGYVLGSPDHKTSEMFGMGDRRSASPQTDLAVVACALKFTIQTMNDLVRRIAALEGRMPV